MSELQFTKMQGAGNDFIMIDNRNGIVNDNDKVALVQKISPRATAVGADGVVFLENDPEHDAKWDFYNADGSSAEMCGNAARCFSLYAHKKGIFENSFSFRTIAGTISGELSGENRAKVKLTDAPLPEKIESLDINDTKHDLYFINTGVPHALMVVDDIEDIDLKNTGAAVRYHDHFAPAGTNVNFIAKDGETVLIRTYERGVEDETLACGTGSVAAAIVAEDAFNLCSPVAVKTRSGDTLNISYAKTPTGISDIYLEGPAVVVYEGKLKL